MSDLGIEFIPNLVLGTGTGEGENGDYGQGSIYQDETGLNLDYHNSETGELRQVKLNDDGITITPSPGGGGDATNIASDTLVIVISETGEFASEEWTHGFDSATELINFLTTPGDYDDSFIQIRDLRVVQMSDTTCKIVGYATVL